MTALPDSLPRARDGAVVRIARWSATHRWTVVGLWLLVVVLAVASADGTALLVQIGRAHV